MRLGNCVLMLALGGGVLLAESARAEVIWLKSGGKVEGELVNRDELDPKIYEIKLAGGGRLTLSVGQVERVIAKSDERRQYETMLPRVPNTLDGHWEMAEHCRKNDMHAERKVHLHKVLQFDPDHAAARRALGYNKIDGQWIKPDEWRKNQGYIRHGGAWKLRQEIELETRAAEREQKEHEWRRKIRLWRVAIVKGRNDAEQAMAQLRDVREPAAIPALADLLNDAAEPKQLKTIYLELLGQFPAIEAQDALLAAVMGDKSSEIADRCLDQLKQHNTDYAVAVLAGLLQDKNNKTINRAGWALGRLGNPKAIPHLIDALVTEHRYRVGSGGSFNLGFGSGGSGMVAGRGAKMVEREFQNKQVHAALVSLVPAGINFVYNEQAWTDWYARRELFTGVDLRRDP